MDWRLGQLCATILPMILLSTCSASSRTRVWHSLARPAFTRRQFWFLRGGGTQGPTLDLAADRKPFAPILDVFPVSVCSVRGYRSHMEDEFVVAGDLAGVFDGHGGEAVSRYLRQNLYGFMQAALPSMVENRTSLSSSADPTSMADMAPINTTLSPPSVEDYVDAFESALEKVDRKVRRISHWSFQGSTVNAVWIHQDAGVRTFITANLGDSRAILSRGARALNLSRDHKPNDPTEKARIEKVGGQVIWHGDMDAEGEPIPGTGVYRVNGNLALSRAIGDRSERPAVSAKPEFSIVEMQEEDDFVVLATDGLWDVMSSSDVVNYVHAILEEADDMFEKDQMASLLVAEALRRGSFDNVTVIVIWLQDDDDVNEVAAEDNSVDATASR